MTADYSIMKKVFTSIFSILFLFCCLISTAFAANTGEITPTVTDNNNRQDYSTWSKPVNSYLVEDSSGYMRVENIGDNKVLITYFDKDLNPLSEKTIDYELPVFGGFYNGSNNYFLVFGQDNKEESNNKEVVKIVKYDKDWKKLGTASLLGANTYIPFDAGSLRMAESGNQLYIRTSHEMFASDDGVHHQANLAMQVDTPSMNIVDSKYQVENSGSGYVSHSFNQFIIIDGDNIIALDHGDAYPRSALLGKYAKKAGGDSFTSNFGGYKSLSVLDFAGEIGANATGASLGGLEASKDNYLTVGNSIEQGSSSNIRNIYVTATPKSDLDSDANNTSFNWLTHNTDKNIQLSTPHLVKYDNDNFLVVWAQKEDGKTPHQISYIHVDGSGKAKGEVKTVEGMISDCKPIISNGKAIWYAGDGAKLSAYSIGSDGSFDEKVIVEPSVDIYRVYNPDNGEHLFTTSPDEVKALTGRGWKNENIGWYAPASGQPVYRLYNNVLLNHLYTTDENEVKTLSAQKDWDVDFEGNPIFYSGGSIPIYRLYNETLSGMHHLTTDENEYKSLPAHGWKQEGVALYAQKGAN